MHTKHTLRLCVVITRPRRDLASSSSSGKRVDVVTGHGRSYAAMRSAGARRVGSPLKWEPTTVMGGANCVAMSCL